jgi:hypothetical protein
MSNPPATFPSSAMRVDSRSAAHRDETMLLWMLGVALSVRLFVPSGLLDLYIHYSQLGGSIFEKVHPGAYLLVALAALILFTQDYKRTQRSVGVARGSYLLLIAVSAAIVVGLLTGRTGGISYLLDSLVLGPIVALTMLRLSPSGQLKILALVLYLLAINDVFLFFEFLTHNRLMPYIYHEPFFRPTAFLGHPLMNGLINATAIAFVWVMPWSSARKLAFSLFFLAACFAAGARMASIFGVLATLMCTWVELGRSVRKGRIDEGAMLTISIGALAFILIALSIVVLSGLADRLVSYGFFNDESSQSRFQIYGMFRYMTFSQLMFGMSREWASYITTEVLNLPRSESPIVDFVVQFGIIGTVILVSGILAYFWSMAFATRNAFAMVGSMIFLATASTNNTFSGKACDMAYFAAFLVGSLGSPVSQHFVARARRATRPVARGPATATGNA